MGLLLLPAGARMRRGRRLRPHRARAGVALIVLAVFSHVGIVAATRSAWRDRAPAPVTDGLWATDAERAEWGQVLRVIAGSRATILSVDGAGAILVPGLVVPDSPYLLPGLATPREVDLAVLRLASVSMVIAPLDPYYGQTPDYWPQLGRELKSFAIAWKGKVFVVYRNPRLGPQRLDCTANRARPILAHRIHEHDRPSRPWRSQLGEPLAHALLRTGQNRRIDHSVGDRRDCRLAVTRRRPYARDFLLEARMRHHVAVEAQRSVAR
jgi:hypothetical protein